MDKKSFNPLIFLASLGAGGISVIPFAFMQYTFYKGEGLVTYQKLGHGSLTGGLEFLFRSFEVVMIVFTLIHILMSIILFFKLFKWIGTEEYKNFISDPLRNSAIMAPFISLGMTMSVFIGPLRFFVPFFSENFQALMLPALIVFAIIWLVLMKVDIQLLKISFEKSFDVSKIHFGWLMHPFALGMITVTGTGLAAMAKNPSIAHTAAFMSMVSGTMGFFLLVVKLISIFKSHFAADGLPEKQFLPSFLIVVPNITLYALSAFRLGHYFHHHLGAHLHLYYTVVIVISFAFETWYLMFGLSMLSDYFKKHFFTRELYLSQWGLICPFVAYAVLGSFVYSVYIPSVIFYVLSLVSTAIAIILFTVLFVRQIRCSGFLFRGALECKQN